MSHFLLDENLPRSSARVLRDAGYDAVDVRDVGLRGHSDAEVFAYAQASGATLITADKGFANVRAYAAHPHAGLIVVRLPNEVPTAEVNRVLLHALIDLQGRDLAGLLIIVQAGRTRIRRPPRVR
ncbi:MAG: DUF5615 family PIN-like protein [Chloroflexi bacterium]|nr:DUF5615 family PIN-like protein [Chloroflexota bacterium]MBI4505085.1 DUF5615 family PIN-like protein [Chloroflexota bacterium]